MDRKMPLCRAANRIGTSVQVNRARRPKSVQEKVVCRTVSTYKPKAVDDTIY